MSSNDWNDFQHEHAGEGLSPGDMSEMYHAEQDAGESGAESMCAADMTNMTGDVADSDSGLASEANSDFDTQPDNSQGEESTNSGNEWNDFQHEHAGEGLSKTEMSEMYHAEQDSQESDPNTSEVVDGHNGEESALSDNVACNSTVNGDPDNDTQQPSQDQSSNQWNEFEHQHQGEGKSSSELADMYHQQQEQQQSVEQQPQQEETAHSAEESVSPSTSNEWNQFQHEHAHEGLSKTEMSEMYHAEQHSHESGPNVSKATEDDNNKGSVASDNTPRENTDTDSTKNENPVNITQAPPKDHPNNQWIEFEHQHKGEGKTSSELADMYHQQQQAQQEKPANSVEEDSSQSPASEWNKFQHEHKDENLTHQQMSTMYHQQHQHKQTENHAQQDAEQLNLNKPNECDNAQRNSQSFSQQTNAFRSQQNQPKQKTKASVQWNLFQHLYGGKGFSKEDMANKYHQFKENEQTFHWHDDYQLAITPDGILQNPDTPAGREALKTGLFDEQNRLRRKGDLPLSVFQAKMLAMGITDRAKIVSMHLNKTGSSALHTENLRHRGYRQHAAVETTRRDPDHILELQVVASELHKVHLNDEDFHIIRCLLNGEENIESRGIKVNRIVKRGANNGIARNHVKLTKFTFEQELVQAEQARKLADICHERGSVGAENVLRTLANKCNSLHAIHAQVMQLTPDMNNSNENCERERRLIENIRSYEKKYGRLNFHGYHLTEYRKEVLDRAHRA